MYMLRHHHITDHPKSVPRPHLIKNFHETIAGLSTSQQRPPPMATERHKMQVASAVNSSQRFSHPPGTPFSRMAFFPLSTGMLSNIQSLAQKSPTSASAVTPSTF